METPRGIHSEKPQFCNLMKYLFQLIEESHQIWEATDLIMDSCSSHSEWNETVVPDSETFFCRVVEYNIMRFNGLLNAEVVKVRLFY